MSEEHLIEVHHGTASSIKVVKVLKRNARHEVVEASVRDQRATVEVVASRDEAGEWRPVGSLKDGEPMDLPPCFSFNEEALVALDAAAQMK